MPVRRRYAATGPPAPNASPPDGSAYQRTVSRNCTPCSGALSFAAARRAPSRLIASAGASDQRAPARHVRFPAPAKSMRNDDAGAGTKA